MLTRSPEPSASDARASSGAGLGYRPALDGLRGLAVLVVVLHHTVAYLVPDLHGTLFPGGFLGVDLFFVLSGFLITMLLLERRPQEGRATLPRFYARRALRILPAIVFLLAARVVYYLVEKPEVLRDALLSSAGVLLYVANLNIVSMPYLGHTWSLAIEEQFYLVFPLVLLGVLARGWSTGRLAAGLLVVAGLVAVWRVVQFSRGVNTYFLYTGTDTRLDGLLLGCVLALLVARAGPRATRPGVPGWVAWSAASGFLAAVLVVQPYSPLLFRGGFVVVALLGCAMTLAAFDGWSAGGLLTARPAIALGRISYAVYLWHYTVFEIVKDRELAPAVALPVGFAIAALGVAASVLLVEGPAARVRRRLDRRWSMLRAS